MSWFCGRHRRGFGSVVALAGMGLAFAGLKPMSASAATAASSQAGADLSVAITESPNPVRLGGVATYTITVRNNGPESASSVTLTTDLPGFDPRAGYSLITCPGSDPALFRTSCDLGAMASGDSATVTVRVGFNAPSFVGTFTLQASVADDGAAAVDPVANNNTASDTVQIAQASSDLGLAIARSPEVVTIGAPVTYTITVTNYGPDDAANQYLAGNFRVDLTLPANAQLIPSPFPSGTPFSNPSVVSTEPASSRHQLTCDTDYCWLGVLPKGAVVTVTVTLLPTSVGELSFSAALVYVPYAGLPLYTLDPNPANDSVTDSTTVGPPVAVTFRSVTALATRGGVLVRWRTASEVDVLGFNLYREVNGRRIRVNTRLIPAHGRGSYSFLDRKAHRGKVVRYWIQAVNLDGSRSWCEPAAVRFL